MALQKNKKLTELTDKIKVGDLATAYAQAKDCNNWDASHAVKCLIELQLLLYGQKIHSFLVSEVFSLADFCCKTLKKSECTAQNMNKVLTCMYYIIQYLLKKHEVKFAKHVSEYVIGMKSENNKSLNTKCNKTLQNIYNLFLVSFYNVDVKLLMETEEDDEDNKNVACDVVVVTSMIDLWKFSCYLRNGDSAVVISDLIMALAAIINQFDSHRKNVIKYIYNKDTVLNELKILLENDVTCLNSDSKAILNFTKLLTVTLNSINSYKCFHEFSLIIPLIEILYEKCDSINQQIYLTMWKRFVQLLHYLLAPTSYLQDESDITSTLENVISDLLKLMNKINVDNSMDKDLFKTMNFLIIQTCCTLKSSSTFSLTNLSKQALNNFLSFLFSVYTFAEAESQDVLSILNILCFILNIILIAHKNDFYKEIVHDSFEFTKKVHDTCLSCLLRIMVESSSKLETYMSCVVGLCYNNHSIFMNAQMFQECYTLSKRLIDFLKHLPRNELLKLSKKIQLSSIIKNYYYCCNKVGKFKDGLITIILWSVVTDSYDKLIEMWTSNKLSSHVPIEITIYTIVDEMKGSHRLMEWGIDEDTLSQINWSPQILREIEFYSKKKSLQVVPLLNAFRYLVSICGKDSKEVLKALVYVYEGASNNIMTYTVEDDVTAVFESVTKKMKRNTDKTPEELCIYGNLLHYKLRLDIYEKRKNIEKTLTKENVRKELVQDPVTGMVVDASETQGARVVDSELLYSKQRSIIKMLDNSLQYLIKAIIKEDTNDGKDDNTFPDLNAQLPDNIEVNVVLSRDLLITTFGNINVIGQLYSLYSESQRAASAWHFLYKISRKGYPNIALSAFINLLGLNISPTIKPSWLTKIAHILSSKSVDDQRKSIKDFISMHFDSKEKDKNELKTKAEFYQKFCVQLARHYLYELNVNKSATIVQEVKSPYADSLTYIHYLLAIGKLRAIRDQPLSVEIEAFEANLAFNEAACRIRHAVYNNEWDSYSDQCFVHKLVLENSFAACQHFLALSLASHARVFLHEELDLSQKLVLPFWTCSLLLLLSWKDVYVYRLEDTEMKLHNIEVILGLKNKLEFEFTSPVPISIDFKDEDPTRHDIILGECDSHILRKREEINMYADESVELITDNQECSRIFVDLIVLKGVFLSVTKRYRAAVRWFNYATKMISSLKDKHDDKVFREQMSGSKAIICFYHAVMLENNRNYTASLQYYKKSLQYCDSGSSKQYLYVITRNSITSKIDNVQFEILWTTDSMNLEGSSSTIHLPVVSSNHNKDKIKTTPTGTKIPVALTPLLKSNTPAKKTNSVLSPGTFPTFSKIAKRLSLSSAEDDNCDIETSSPLTNNNGRKSNRSAARKAITTPHPVNKDVVSTTTRKTRSTVKKCDVTKLTKSVSKICIYNDDTENMATTSNRRPSRIPKCKKELLPSDVTSDKTYKKPK